MIYVLGVICIYVFVLDLYLVEIELRCNKINNGFKVIVCMWFIFFNDYWVFLWLNFDWF